MRLFKTIVSGSPYAAPGQVLTYQLRATNVGNVTLTNVAISDPKLGALTCAQPVTLRPGEALTCTGTYTITQADVDRGSVTNIATATGQDPNGVPLSAADNAAATAARNVALQVFKVIVSGSPYAAPGNVLRYQLVATNTGNVTLTNVSLSDPKLGPLTCPQPVTLRPGEALTCTGSYTVSQADVDAGFVLNTATARGTETNGVTVTASDSATAPAAQRAALQVVKTLVSGSPYRAPGDVITYQLIATNTGSVTLTNVTLSDPKLGGLTCAQPVTLLPGQALTCTGHYP